MTQKASVPDQSRTKEQTISGETILKMTKEIAVKFIEVGRLTPSTFDQVFKEIHQTIEETAQNDD